MDDAKIKGWLRPVWRRIYAWISKGRQFFEMDDDSWKHYANPLSLWIRLFCFPVLAVAIYARVWWGAWSWIIVLLSSLWIWLNPKIFPAPHSTKNWASFATFGERVWLHRHDVPIPYSHQWIANALSAVMLINLFPLAYGLIEVNAAFVFFPVMIQMIAKLWFYDRMVWLYTQVQADNPTYASWMY